MTSLLRRKRQTIVRGTRPATTLRGCKHRASGEVVRWFAASPYRISAFGAVLFLWAGSYMATPVRASENGDDEAVQTAQYSTGASGSRLKWLPLQSEAASSDSTVKAVQYTQSSNPQRTVRTAQNGGVLGDPFGDKKPKSSPAPAEKLGDELLQQVPAEPKSQQTKPQEALPGLPPLNEPAATKQPAEKSYLEPKEMAPLSSPKRAKAAPKRPLLDEQYATQQHEFNEKCPSPKDLKPIAELNTDIKPSEGDLPHDCPLGNATFRGRSFPEITYTWTASGLCHKPLYFEDVQLERYGHMAGPFVQPFASATNFFLTFPILPYKMGLEPPNECMYSLGYYRPGDCAPYLFDPLPLSVRGALFEAGGWVAGVCVIP